MISIIVVKALCKVTEKGEQGLEIISTQARSGDGMIYGTHNSATGGHLVWWLKPLAWVINPTSKCQDRTIQEQLKDDVRLFNLQVAYIGGKWRFSHGLALYKEDVMLIIRQLRAWATRHEPIYFQLYLDKCFWCKQNIEEFEKLINHINDTLCCECFCMLPPWVEGTDITYKGSPGTLGWEERYWTRSWAKENAQNWVDYLPLPKRYAKRWNATYKVNCKREYLMLDYYELG